MSFEINDYQFDTFNRYLKDLCGIWLTPDKKYLVQNRLAEFIQQNYRNDFQLFLIEWPKASEEVRKTIIELMTTRETFWFRDVRQFDFLKEKLFPEYAEEVRRGDRSHFKIWSAACSSGQEPYTIAMILCESFPSLLGINSRPIFATDISKSALEQAEKGCYGKFELSRGLPDHYIKYVQGNTVSAKVRNCIDFKPLNLIGSYAMVGRHDIIFLRNVLIYFTEETKTEILKKMHAHLNPKGRLFLSTTERINGLEEYFEKDPSGLFYNKKEMLQTSLGYFY